MIEIKSFDNQKLKNIRKLEQKKYRELLKEFVIFGDDIIKEARDKGQVKYIVSCNHEKECDFLVSQQLFKELDFEKLNVDILAVCKMLINEDILINKGNILILDGISDPVNSGSIYRSAAAFNYKTVFQTDQSVDVYNPKAIRNSKGAFFYLDLQITNSLENLFSILKKAGYLIVGADAHIKNNNEHNVAKYCQQGKIVLVLGNETNGLSKFSKKNCDILEKIETLNVESLNVNAAAAILMYQFKDF